MASTDVMPPLFFPCVVTRLDREAPPARCRTWIQGRDLRELAEAAAQELDTCAGSCAFTILAPDSPPGRVFIEVLHETNDALVGPMAGPSVPPALSTMPQYHLDDLMGLLGLADAPDTATAQTRYVATVRYSSIWDAPVYPPDRKEGEGDAAYRARCAAVENLLIDRASHQGFFPLQCPVPANEWTSGDLGQVVDLLYQQLPTCEPRSHESGWISHHAGERAQGSFVHVARGDYVATLPLPELPTPGLAQWLCQHRCVIDLYHPIRTPRRAVGACSDVPATGSPED